MRLRDLINDSDVGRTPVRTPCTITGAGSGRIPRLSRRSPRNCITAYNVRLAAPSDVRHWYYRRTKRTNIRLTVIEFAETFQTGCSLSFVTHNPSPSVFVRAIYAQYTRDYARKFMHTVEGWGSFYPPFATRLQVCTRNRDPRWEF